MTKFFNHKIHVLFKREDLNTVKLEGKVAIVLDILFATTTIVSALAKGVSEVYPVKSETDALNLAKNIKGNFAMAGELYAETINGFFPPTPLALIQEDIKGKKLIYSTTNGTVALNQSSSSYVTFVGALINAKSIVNNIINNYPKKKVVIVCSGSMGNPNLEDVLGAGYFVKLFTEFSEISDSQLSDSSKIAKSVFESGSVVDTLKKSRVGNLMADKELDEEVLYASNLSCENIVPIVDSNCVIKAKIC